MTNNIQVNETERRVLINLHFLGHMGPMGSMNKKQRLKVLHDLTDKGLLNSKCQITELGHYYAQRKENEL